jgi:hypothetical protein
MKTKQEIKDEIYATMRSKDNFVEAFRNGKIDKRTLEYKLHEYETTILTLSWVLGEIDRWD